MKNKIFLLLLLPTLLFAQSFKRIKDTRTGKPIVVGICTRTALMDSSLGKWFEVNYNVYGVDTVTLKTVKPLLKDYSIKIVMATWCGDSRREVPRFYKILDFLGYPDSNVTLVCVDRHKQGLAEETKGLNIQRVPTFIFYRNGEEKGRIIERPVESLEKDMWKILKRQNRTN